MYCLLKYIFYFYFLVVPSTNPQLNKKTSITTRIGLWTRRLNKSDILLISFPSNFIIILCLNPIISAVCKHEVKKLYTKLQVAS